VGASAFVVFAACAFSPLSNVLATAAVGPDDGAAAVGPADAIVVLGGGLNPDGSLTSSSLRRVLRGILLQRAHVAPQLVLLGSKEEAQTRAALAHQLGVPPNATVMVAGARTTREEAWMVRGVVALDRSRIVLVTDRQHMPRARRLFQRLSFAAQPAETDDIPYPARQPEDRLRLTRRVVEEYAARIYYHVAGYLS